MTVERSYALWEKKNSQFKKSGKWQTAIASVSDMDVYNTAVPNKEYIIKKDVKASY